MKKVMAFGTFDLLHPGHLHYLKEAKKLGDELIVLIARDETVRKVKNKLPKNNETIRFENIKKLGIANKVILGDLVDKFKVIREEKPDILAFGYDQKMPIENIQEKIGSHIQMITISAFKPEEFKSSKLKQALI